MRRWIDQWPALIWPGMSLASLYILAGTSGRWRPTAFFVGVVLALVTFGLALYLATRPIPGRPRERRLFWPMAGLGVWYVALAAAAGLAGPWYAVAGLAAGLIPLTALSLIVALVRRKTVVTEDGRLRDISADADDDPFPGIGVDDDSPSLGDTPQHAGEAPTADKPGGRRFQREQDRKAEQTRGRR
jgi:hypothetical protein